MSLRHGLLGLIKYQPRTGYDLDKFFQMKLQHFWQVKTSQVYKELNDLEKNGMLSSEIVLQTGVPNRKVYSITPAGQAELERWVGERKNLPVIEAKDPFMLKFFFSGELGLERSIEMLRSYREQCEKARAEIEAELAAMEEQGWQLNKTAALTHELVRGFGRRVLELKINWAGDSLDALEKYHENASD